MRLKKWWPYVAMGVLAAGALFVGSRSEAPARTTAGRVAAITQEVRCPTCEGLSAADSDAKAALAIREEVNQRVQAGETDGEIKSYLASRYGNDILLKPGATSWSWLVWALPVAVAIVAAGLVGVRMRTWSSRGMRTT